MSDVPFYEGGAFRGSASVDKEDLLKWENLDADWVSARTNRILRWGLGDPSASLVEDYVFDMQVVKAVLDWACTKRVPAYPANNFILGMPWTECVRSFLRHVKAHREGDFLDHESLLPHTWHAECNLYFLVIYVATNTGVDDR